MSPEHPFPRASSEADLSGWRAKIEREATGESAAVVPPPRVETPLKQLLFRRVSKMHWKSDDDAAECFNLNCRKPFTLFDRRHHCRRCGDIFCSACCRDQLPLSKDAQPVPDGVPSRVCQFCFDEHQRMAKTDADLSLPRPSKVNESTTDAKTTTLAPMERLIVRRSSTDPLSTSAAAAAAAAAAKNAAQGIDGAAISGAGNGPDDTHSRLEGAGSGEQLSTSASDYARDDNTVTFFAERRRTLQFRDQRYNGGRRPSLVAAMLDDQGYKWSTF